MISRYFFVDGECHKKIAEERAKDILIAYNYVQEKTISYSLSSVKKYAERGYITAEVMRMIPRCRFSLRKYHQFGELKEPFRTVVDNGGVGKFIWTEKDILDLHTLLLEKSMGRPRIDKRPVVDQRLPTRAELIAMMRQGVVTYVKNKKGDFVPIWQARDW